MAATVIILPQARRDDGATRLPQRPQTIAVSFDRLTMVRLKRRASEWGVSEAEAAAAIVAESLKPKRQR